MASRSPCARWLASFPQAQILEQAMAVLCGRYSLAKHRFNLTLTLYLKKFNLHTNLELTCQIKSVPQFHTYLQIPLETGEEIAAKLMGKSA